MPVTEYAGDLFSVPEGSVLIHSCNCQGSWGGGVAAAFRDKFPTANVIYEDYCLTPDTCHHKKWLVGTTLLIPPQKEDKKKSGSYWIACLMTSLHHGGRVDKPAAILGATQKAMEDLKKKLKVQQQRLGISLEDKLFTIRMNSDLFKVPWTQTKSVLQLSRYDIKVVNNLEIMKAQDVKDVQEVMKAQGTDTTPVTDWDKVLGIGEKAEKTQEGEDGEDGEESNAALTPKSKKRKKSQAESEAGKKKKKKSKKAPEPENTEAG